MESIDIDEVKKKKNEPVSVIKQEDLSPIEIESTAHLDKQKYEEAKATAVVQTKKELGSYANEVFDWLESILMGIIAIVIIFTFFVRVNTVSGPSMNPTLTNGEKLLVTDLFYTPAYNDIVIIQAANLVNENGELGKPIVKRVIGLPGDIIKIDFDNGVVYRNGSALKIEDIDGYLYEDGHKINDITTLQEDMPSNTEIQIPDGCYFVMGDNRNDSLDSRSAMVGIIQREYIAGKAVFAILPFDRFGAL